MFFKNRKSRKQLLKEIEELKEELTKFRYDKLESEYKLEDIKLSIKKISTSCLYHSIDYSDIHQQVAIEDCLCKQLAKELLPYISFEKYAYAPIDPYLRGEAKYIASINVVDKK